MSSNLDNKDSASSMEDILADIRGVISGDKKPEENLNIKTESTEVKQDIDNEEILELTDIVSSPNEVNNILSNQDVKIDSLASNLSDVNNSSPTNEITIDNIDNIFGNNTTLSTNEASNLVSNGLSNIVEPEVIIAPGDPLKTDFSPNINPISSNNQTIKEDTSTHQDDIKGSEDDKISDEDHKKNLLISDNIASETSEQFKKLLRSATKPSSGVGLRSGVTLEDLVVEALKPQLSDWLENNLPGLVKALVEKEIRRLIPNDDE